jgi:hypothetical protein
MLRCLGVWLLCVAIVAGIWLVASDRAVQSRPLVTQVEPEIVRRAMEFSRRCAIERAEAEPPEPPAELHFVFDDRSEIRDSDA